MPNSWEIENFLTVKDGRLYVDGIDTNLLASEHGTPLFVFSESRIRHNIEKLKKAATVIERPLKLCYAAKAMSTMGILRAIKDAGSDIEVNSGGELWKALRAGFTGEQINFNGNSKEIWELEMAIDNEIYAIQVDSVYELSLIEETAAVLGKRANVSLRLVPEIRTSTHSGLQTAKVTSKFGMMPDEAFDAFRKYKDSPSLNLSGIHLHIGSQNPEPEAYAEALRMLFDSLMRIETEAGVRLSHINLGGGFPVNYLRGVDRASEFPVDQREMFSAEFEPSEAVGDAWEKMKEFANDCGAGHLLEELTLLLEPGRFIIADAGICLTTVRNQKSRPIDRSKIQDPVSGIENWLLTDAGFNILLSMETYKWYYHLVSAERAGEPHDTPYKVAGPLCDGGDVYFDHEGGGRLPEHRLLPTDVRPGEVLALLNCGAYSLAQASQYNGRFLPSVLLIGSDGTVKLIRRRDTFEDLIGNDLWS
jgi:D-ornithine/D-lysine decarboxylase